MPIYEYKCQKCGREFEELVLNKKAVVVCPSCGDSSCEKWMSACRTRSAGGEFGDFSPSSGGGACGGCSSTSCAGCGVSR